MEKILEVKNLRVSFRTAGGILRAVRGISFGLSRGETLAIVGESGSGKSVTSKAIMGILAGNAIVEDGEIVYGGSDLLRISEEEMCKIRGDRISMIFQDPLSSLDPIVRIGKQITEAMILKSRARQKRAGLEYRAYLKRIKKGVRALVKSGKLTGYEGKEVIDTLFAVCSPAKPMGEEEEFLLRLSLALGETGDFGTERERLDKARKMLERLKGLKSEADYRITKREARRRAIGLMEEVGIPEPETRYYQYPFEFSGGMRQRIVIAIALAANPDVLICDEPTTALDVTIQAQILELIERLKKERGLSVIFITHDLGVVAKIADRIAVMYAGKIVEIGECEEVFYQPRHPYTWALLSSVPDLNTTTRLDTIPGTPPNMIYPPTADAFAPRNRYALEIDFELEPPMFNVTPTHSAATWLLHPDAPRVEMPRNARG